MLITYLGHIEAGFEAADAFECVIEKAAFYGDDNAVRELPHVAYSKLCSRLGLKIKLQIIPFGEPGVNFVGRVAPRDIWFGNDGTTCDILRQLGKLHITKAPPSVPNAVVAIDKCVAIMQSDPTTPLIGQFARKVLLAAGLSDGDARKAYSERKGVPWAGYAPLAGDWPVVSTAGLEELLVMSGVEEMTRLMAKWLEYVPKGGALTRYAGLKVDLKAVDDLLSKVPTFKRSEAGELVLSNGVSVLTAVVDDAVNEVMVGDTPISAEDILELAGENSAREWHKLSGGDTAVADTERKKVPAANTRQTRPRKAPKDTGAGVGANASPGVAKP